MSSKKIFLITSLLIIPLILSACSFAFSPGSGSKISGAKGVFKSDTKGEAWFEQNKIKDSQNTISRHDAYKLQFDIFDTRIIYLSTNAGLFISEDSGGSWRQINSNSIYDFVLNPKTRGIIYIATNNQVYKTTNNGESWQLLYAEAKPNITIHNLAISYFDTSHVYLLDSDGTLLMSLDWGDSWKAIHNFNHQDVKDFLIDPHNSQNIYVATGQKFYQSLDQGVTWQDIMENKNQTHPGINQYKQLFFTHQPNNLVYLSKYGILTSADNGHTWQPITLITSPNSVDIHTMAFNPANPDEIYYTVGNILYHTVDNGRNWKTKLLPVPGGGKASQLLIDPNNPNLLYLAITG